MKIWKKIVLMSLSIFLLTVVAAGVYGNSLLGFSLGEISKTFKSLDDNDDSIQPIDATEPLTEADLDKIIYIRNEGHTVMEAINRQLAHYPYHVGQIIFLAKMLADNNWKSLSIPKNKSQDYNDRKFSQEKGNSFFTDKV